jgi:hypothetical protein
MGIYFRGIALLTAALLVQTASGGLQEREQEVKKRSAAKKKDNGSADRSRDDAAHSAFGSGTYPSSGEESFLSGFWGWLVAAPFQYRHDDPAGSMSGEGEWAQGNGLRFPLHQPGQPTVPVVRFDYHYQFVDNDQPTDVHDGRLEAGYKWFAFHGRMTRYIQEDDFILDLRQYYGVLRYGGRRPDFVPGTFEFGIGLGMVHHTGDVEDDTSGAFTIPLKYHPADWVGFEFRPAWYRWDEITIGDYDLSLSLGGRFVQLRGGYRWLWDNGLVDVQSGPYAGFSLSF